LVRAANEGQLAGVVGSAAARRVKRYYEEQLAAPERG